MTATELRTAVKTRLGIATADTKFDAMIDEFGLSAVRRLYPSAAYEVAPQETSTFTTDGNGETLLDLTTFDNTKAARQIEAWNGYGWQRITDTYHHGTTLRLREIESTFIKLRIYGVREFKTITEVYEWLHQAVIWYVQAEFFAYMADNATNYTAYLQTTGARAVDNLTDLSNNYEVKADRFLNEQAQAYGL